MTFDEWWTNYCAAQGVKPRNFRIDSEVLRDAFEAGRQAGTPDPLPVKKSDSYVVECTGCGERVELDANEPNIIVQITPLTYWEFNTQAEWRCPNCACKGKV